VDDPVAVALKFGFLAVLYLFLLWVARSARRDLVRAADGELREEPLQEESESGLSSDLGSAVQPVLEVVAAMGHEPGAILDIAGGAMLGRGDAADVNVQDPFASSVHARIYSSNGFMYIEDMGSTNGTYLNGRQLKRAEQLRPADVIRIGDTEYRYQE
jgi:hypothetical protein